MCRKSKVSCRLSINGKNRLSKGDDTMLTNYDAMLERIVTALEQINALLEALQS